MQLKIDSEAKEILERYATRCGVTAEVVGEYTDDLDEALQEVIGHHPNLSLLVITNLLTRVAKGCDGGLEEALDTAVRLIDVFVELDPDTFDESEEEEDGDSKED